MVKMIKFWTWEKRADESTLYIDGEIAPGGWMENEAASMTFRDEVRQCEGDLTVSICSPGGDVFAAAQIYNILLQYPGKITVNIDGLAASAASVIAMAGDTVNMSPVSWIMIHDPILEIAGNAGELRRGIELLEEIKEGIVTAYQQKSGLSRHKISQLMDCATWLNARKAVEMGFADKVVEREGRKESHTVAASTYHQVFSIAATLKKLQKITGQNKQNQGRDIGELLKKLTEMR